LGCSRRSRIILARKGIISISTVRFYRSIMRKYTIFCRYGGVYIGFPETEGIESALVQTGWDIRGRTGIVRNNALSGLFGADEARGEE
jgi:hypothetical protein